MSTRQEILSEMRQLAIYCSRNRDVSDIQESLDCLKERNEEYERELKRVRECVKKKYDL